MKLSEKEALVLASCDLRADAPMTVLRKETGLRDHTIRYALKNLADRQIIKPVPLINIYRLGYSNYNLYFSLGSQKQGQKAALLTSLLKMPAISWFGEFGGDFQYGMTILASSPVRAVEIIKEISKDYQGVILDKSFGIQFSVTLYNRRYLSTKSFSMTSLSLTSTKEFVEVDDLDKVILEALTVHGTLSHRQLAQKLKVPLSTLELRIRKLKENGVIAGEIFAVNPTKYGMRQFNLLVFAKGLSSPLNKALHQFCKQHHHVTYLIECMGSWDYVIGVEIEQTEEVTRIVQDLYDQLSEYISHIKLLAKFKDVKSGWFKNIPETFRN